MKSKILVIALFCLLFAPGSGFGEEARPCPALIAVEPIADELPFYDEVRSQFRNPRANDEVPPLRVLLSRERYWRQDGHLDIAVRLDAPGGIEPGETMIEVRLIDGQGSEATRFDISPVPAAQFIFYPALPEDFLGPGTAEITWRGPDGVLADARLPFRVEKYAEPAPRAGRIPLVLENTDALHLEGLPVTVGVPFPRGALYSADHLRLVDEEGQAIPVQIKETARWSKYGPVKWVLCDFTVDLAGGPRRLSLEYGPGVSRAERAVMAVTPGNGFPVVDAGRLKIEDGIWFDAGHGHVRLLEAGALNGAFVEHENGRLFRPPLRDEYAVEEIGPEKAVIRREGWYREATGDGEFCRYITRYILHRDSPLVRIVHTWIFTGDGNRDRIANMGWAFPLADDLAPIGFLTGYGGDGRWESGDFLLQWDYDHFDILRGEELHETAGGRAAGAAAAAGPGAKLYLGVKDFWQNYPSELEFRDGALWFHNWPRHNRPAGWTLDRELVTAPGAPALPSAARHGQYEPGRLTRSEWKLNAVQARFAHEGEMLDFRLPEAFGRDPIWSSARGAAGWEDGNVESGMNAQGISRTEEMWLYLAGPGPEAAGAAALLGALNDERARAVVDPAWVAASGAFYEMRHRDPDHFPEEERIYEMVALSYGKIAERLGAYGMWVYGDLPAWWPQLDTREPALYRTWRMSHHAWPYSWKPYARSGDIRLFRFAQAATRQMIDAGFCHYASEDVRRIAGEGTRPGRRIVSTVPWSRGNPATRSLADKCDYLWQAWYLSGCHRAREHALHWGELTKIEEDLPRRGILRGVNRDSITLLKSYLEMYEATFDPWFLVAAHELARWHETEGRYDPFGWLTWETAEREFLRFTGSESFRAAYLEYAGRVCAPSPYTSFSLNSPQLADKVFTWKIAGDEYALRRVSRGVEFGNAVVLDGGPRDDLIGFPAVLGQHTGYTLFAGYYLRWLPTALWALHEAGYRPVPAENEVASGARLDETDNGDRVSIITFKKETGQSVPLRLALWRTRAEDTATYRVVGPDGESVLSGTWSIPERRGHGQDVYETEIQAGAPAGVYRLKIIYDNVRSTAAGVHLPITALDSPEVIEINPGEPLFSLGYDAPLWFMVPEGVESFHLHFPAASSISPSVWCPDGKRAWSLGLAGNVTFPARVDIPVAPHQAGRLWRISLPPMGMVFDPVIPPVFAINPNRWFLPDDSGR